jgi:late competence protein required for DNA uptake (superfamily II DNA/RNA helicase)
MDHSGPADLPLEKGGIMRESIDNKSQMHCRRCDSENRRPIKFKSPDNQPYYLCSRCVELEDKREVKFSSSWRRSRRPTSKIAVAG